MRRFLSNIHWGDKLIDILVVVLGITIAFALNNWRENRQNAKLEQQYLRNLKEDLVKDSVGLDYSISHADEIFFSIERIQRLAGQSSNADSIYVYLGAIGDDNLLIFKPEDYSYSTMQQTGNITLIETDSIRRNLSQLYDTYELLEMQTDFAFKYQFDRLFTYYYNYDFQSQTTVDDQMYLTSNFRNTIRFYSSNLKERRRLMREALLKIRSLLHSIDHELDE